MRPVVTGLTRQLRAVAVVSRLSETVGYNVASVLLAIGIGVRVGGMPDRWTVWLAVGYATATMVAKFQASVADAIHDRAVDASNPEKNRIAVAVETLGRRRAWLLLGSYLLLSLALYAALAVVVGAWVFAAGVAVIVLGFTYSYPPRFKERGVWNHVVTTGADAGLLVFPVAVLVGGRVAPLVVVAVALIACYSFGYHVLHQAADVYFDRQAGVETFATAVGVDRSLTVAAVTTAAAAGFALALGYAIAALTLGLLTVFYIDLFYSIREATPQTATQELADRFSIAWVATVANGAFAVAVWRHALGTPIVDALL